jgi:hypothetical protein
MKDQVTLEKRVERLERLVTALIGGARDVVNASAAEQINALGMAPTKRQLRQWCAVEGCTFTKPKCDACHHRKAALVAKGMPPSGRKA